MGRGSVRLGLVGSGEVGRGKARSGRAGLGRVWRGEAGFGVDPARAMQLASKHIGEQASIGGDYSMKSRTFRGVLGAYLIAGGSFMFLFAGLAAFAEGMGSIYQRASCIIIGLLGFAVFCVCFFDPGGK